MRFDELDFRNVEQAGTIEGDEEIIIIENSRIKWTTAREIAESLVVTGPNGEVSLEAGGTQFGAFPILSTSGVSKYVQGLSSRKSVRLDALKIRVASLLNYKNTNAVYYDNTATTSTGAGTITNPFNTWAQVKTFFETTLAGAAGGYTLFVKCGTVTRGGASLVGVYGLKDSNPFQIMPYGDGPLPVFAGGDLVAASSWVDQGNGVYSYAVAANCDCFENGDRLLKKTITTGTEKSTLLAAGKGVAGYNSTTGILWIYPQEISNILEINNATDGLVVNIAGNSNAGNVHIYGMHGRLAKDHGVAITSHDTTATYTHSGCSIQYCAGGNVGVDQVGAGGGVGDGIMLYGPVGNADAYKATYVSIRGNYSYDCLNNGIELAATSGAVVEFNESDNVGGNMCELWSCNDSAHVRYNLHRGDSLRLSRLNGSYFSATMAWVNGILKNGTVDAAATYNNNNKVYFNIAINPGIRGVRCEGGHTGTKIHHNTFIYTDNGLIGSNPIGAVMYSVCNTGTTQAVDVSRNLVAGLGQYLPGVVIVCDGTAAITPTGDYNVYSGLSCGWRKGGTTYWTLANWQAAIGAGMDANSLACTNSGGTVTHDELGLDVVSGRISPVGLAASFGTDSLGYVRDFAGVPISSVAGAGFAGAMAPH